MKVFVSTDFQGHYPVGTAAVVTAHDEDEARAMLSAEIANRGLPASEFTLSEIPTRIPTAAILRDGNY